MEIDAPVSSLVFCLYLRSCCIDIRDLYWFVFFFQAEDGIRDRSPSRGLGDVYKRQAQTTRVSFRFVPVAP